MTVICRGDQDGQMVYSRAYNSEREGTSSIRRSPTPGTMKHQGIEDAFMGKASTVYYATGTKWRAIAGAD